MTAPNGLNLSENDQAIEAAYREWEKARARLNLYWSGIDNDSDITKLCAEYDATVALVANYRADSSLGVLRQLDVAAHILAAHEIDPDTYFASNSAFALVARVREGVSHGLTQIDLL